MRAVKTKPDDLRVISQPRDLSKAAKKDTGIFEAIRDQLRGIYRLLTKREVRAPKAIARPARVENTEPAIGTMSAPPYIEPRASRRPRASDRPRRGSIPFEDSPAPVVITRSRRPSAAMSAPIDPPAEIARVNRTSTPETITENTSSQAPQDTGPVAVRTQATNQEAAPARVASMEAAPVASMEAAPARVAPLRGPGGRFLSRQERADIEQGPSGNEQSPAEQAQEGARENKPGVIKKLMEGLGALQGSKTVEVGGRVADAAATASFGADWMVGKQILASVGNIDEATASLKKGVKNLKKGIKKTFSMVKGAYKIIRNPIKSAKAGIAATKKAYGTAKNFISTGVQRTRTGAGNAARSVRGAAGAVAGEARAVVGDVRNTAGGAVGAVKAGVERRKSQQRAREAEQGNAREIQDEQTDALVDSLDNQTAAITDAIEENGGGGGSSLSLGGGGLLKSLKDKILGAGAGVGAGMMTGISKLVKIGGPIAALTAGVSKFIDVKDDDELNTAQKTTQVAATAGGALAGAATGAALGAFLGPIGMLVGGAIGGIAGSEAGEWVGEMASGFLADEPEDLLKKSDKSMPKDGKGDAMPMVSVSELRKTKEDSVKKIEAEPIAPAPEVKKISLDQVAKAELQAKQAAEKSRPKNPLERVQVKPELDSKSITDPIVKAIKDLAPAKSSTGTRDAYNPPVIPTEFDSELINLMAHDKI